MTAVRSVTATFTIQTRTLSVSTNGTGSGSVTGTGINCPGDCSETYNYGAPVTLTANPATGSDFSGWSGACSGTGTCTVNMTITQSVTATFTIQTYTLTVNLEGPGNGTVNGTGISCPGDCSEILNYGTNVTLSAIPAPGSGFTGWSGACSGTDTCTVNMTTTQSVTATFLAPTFSDVPLTHWAWDWIERLYNSGITTGCGGGLYCPEQAVTRAQMAVFLIRGIHGTAFIPPAPTGIFADVPTTAWASDYIEQLYADGITTGCNPALMLYCPSD